MSNSIVSRTVELELLRSGPRHNHLLSPLTVYLGLCGNFDAATVRVPHEHRQFLGKLRCLDYEAPHADRQHARITLEDTGRDIARILDGVPGFAHALSMDECDKQLTHFELVVSAAELALLPFELSKVPSRIGGGDDWLLLQSEIPVCLTRRVRTVSSECVRWPGTPRILFAYASPDGMTVPAVAHAQALIQAIRPWLKPYHDLDNARRRQNRRDAVREFLTLLPNASIHDIERACGNTRFSHVHVLAHGDVDSSDASESFGLALCKRGTKGRDKEIVSGKRLATALQLDHRGVNSSSSPAVVTIASCYSGRRPNVIYTGASMAHELHESGIPLVVASQFPLTKVGSVYMVQQLYADLLWGKDPRSVLYQLRRRLFALQSPDVHDWASLVVYAALPADLRDQLERNQYDRADMAIKRSLKTLDKTVEKLHPESKTKLSQEDQEDVDKLVNRQIRRVEQIWQQAPSTGKYATHGRGLRASAAKRCAEVLFRYATMGNADKNKRNKLDENKQKKLDASFSKLLESRDQYRRGAEFVTTSVEGVARSRVHWFVCQYSSLQVVLGENVDQRYWNYARICAEVDTECGNETTVAWAHGSLAELYLLCLSSSLSTFGVSEDEAEEKARKHFGLVIETSPESFPVYSTMRQLYRYVDWWGSESFVQYLTDQRIDRAELTQLCKVASDLADDLAKALKLRT